MWSRTRRTIRSDIFCFFDTPERNRERRKSHIFDTIEFMSKYNVRNIDFEKILDMPPSMRLELLERLKHQYDDQIKNDPIGAGIERML